MKKFSFLFLIIGNIFFINAQGIGDALRYSTEQNVGTARFTALSGAMGALGGDLSAMSINPAGSAVFLNSNVTLSASLFDVENNSTYFNNRNKSFSDDINLNQAGGVFVFDNFNEESIWKKFTVGVNYNIYRNFDNRLYISGSGNNSISNFFVQQAQGIPLNLLVTQQNESISELYDFLGQTQGTAAQNALLGYQGFIFDPVDADNPNNSAYVSNVANGSFNQDYVLLSEGYNGKFSINFGAQITDKFYIGVNLNTHTIDFQRSTLLLEDNSNLGSTVNNIAFQNNLAVYGAGFSAQIGGIAKISDEFRVGLSLDTPTWYQISEETTQYLETQRTKDGQQILEIINPNVINVFEDYTLKTPGKVTASGAYIFGKSGLISFDYSYKDYSQIEFRPSNNTFFSDQNTIIQNSLQGASTFKAGGEYRINQISLRGGFHYEQSPYQNEDILSNLIGFSLGTGYNFGDYSFDLAYSRSEQERNQQLYSIGLTDSTKINTVYSNFIASLIFNF
ncbi:OmpP1/FadL family transporter [Aequorivita echinoideorum]|uniref:Transporter n=1 Tax=Aequorivita echinoideorum TaxID=1549647 RepID=A0ABS5S295_9FLAO|nr:transporter [Aequorivita echinoideorum]MBT0607328.1 transporter [Aequorivita echinoideorum]